MFFEVAALQEIELPDSIDTNDEDEVRQYIQDNWDDIPLPDTGTWDYICGTCQPDVEGPIQVIG